MPNSTFSWARSFVRARATENKSNTALAIDQAGRDEGDTVEVTVQYPQTHLLGLPREIRDMIFLELFKHELGPGDLGFLLSCWQLYHETSVAAFAATHFLVSMNKVSLIDRANRLSEAQKAAVKRFTLTYPGGEGIFTTVDILREAAIQPTHVTYDAGPQLKIDAVRRKIHQTIDIGRANAYNSVGDFGFPIFELFFDNPRLQSLTWAGLSHEFDPRLPRHVTSGEDKYKGPWDLKITRMSVKEGDWSDFERHRGWKLKRWIEIMDVRLMFADGKYDVDIRMMAKQRPSGQQLRLYAESRPM